MLEFMRKTIVPAAMASAFVLAGATAAQADGHEGHMSGEADATGKTTVVVALLPKDEEALRTLEQRHRRIINTAQRQCTTSLGGINRSDRDPCVISGVETGVEISDDPVLKAFHEALPMSVRYDGDRPDNTWRIGLDDEAPDGIITTE
ncbi:hypothetical protein [Pyruvatibacter mobilis]|uniref:hypothetical protein n=1 Tax=Pyruvatibacter mobilis TaxID=1712261 RepID=UPI003BAD1EE2